MTRFLLAVTILSYALIPIALSADVPAKPAPASAAPVYVKIIWPFDPAAPVVEGDSHVVESWIDKSIDEDRRQANFRAVNAWVPLVEGPFEVTDLWNGPLDGVTLCPFGADIIERKDGWIKISFRGWSPGGAEATVTLQDETGSREVVPFTQFKTERGTPHIAIFVGLRVK